VTRLLAARPDFDFRQRREFFLFATESRPALGPTKPPISCVRVALSQGIKRKGREAGNSSPSSTQFLELYRHSPNTSPWRSSDLRTETTSPLFLLDLWGHSEFADGRSRKKIFDETLQLLLEVTCTVFFDQCITDGALLFLADKSPAVGALSSTRAHCTSDVDGEGGPILHCSHRAQD
jgi:hypothetical protein